MLLLDNSAWSRIVGGVLDEKRAETVAEWIEQRQLATTLPFLLEAGYSAKSGGDHKTLMDQLDLLPSMRISQDVENQALRAQGELALIGHHRLSPVDLMIAACAHDAGFGVLHYDRDYDMIAEHTCLEFASRWLAPPGTF